MSGLMTGRGVDTTAPGFSFNGKPVGRVANAKIEAFAAAENHRQQPDNDVFHSHS